MILRTVIADYVRKLPVDLRTYILPFIYGLFGGLAAVAFQKLAGVLFSYSGKSRPNKCHRGLSRFSAWQRF